MDENTNVTKDEEIEAHIHEMLKADPENLSEIEKYLEKVEEDYSDDIYDFAFREAIRSNALNYVDEHADDFDLEGMDGSSSYLDEAEDEEMEELLMDHGAFRSWDDYSDCRFAMETVNNEILAFSTKFQKEVFKKYLSFTGLTKKKVMEMLEDDYDIDDDSELPEGFDRSIEDDFAAMGITLEDDKIEYLDMTWENGTDTRDLLEELGWICEFEGEYWKLQTTGVFFIR